MLLTTEPNTFGNTQIPTSVYLNSENITESASLSMKLNEGLLSNPTSPHLNRLWKITVKDNNVYFATPDSIFQSLGMAPYFKQLLRYQVSPGIIAPNDISDYKYRKLYRKFLSSIQLDGASISPTQRTAFVTILQELSANPNVSIHDLHIQVSADHELAIFRKGETGTHYLLVGDNENDISYMYVSTTPGIYFSLHKTDNILLKDILESFVAW